MSTTQDYAKIILKHLAGKHDQLRHAGAKKKKGDEIIHHRKGMSGVDVDWSSAYYGKNDPAIAAAAKADEEYASANPMEPKPFLLGRKERAEKYMAQATKDLKQAEGMFWASFHKATPALQEAARLRANKAKAMAIGTLHAWDDWGHGGFSTKCDHCGEEFPQNLVRAYPAMYGMTRSINVCGECVSKRVEADEAREGIKGSKFVGGTNVESKFRRERAAGDLVQETVEKLRATSPVPEESRQSGLAGEQFLEANDPDYWKNKPAWLRRKHERDVQLAQAKKKAPIGEEYLSAEKPILPGGPITTKVEIEPPKKD